MNRLFARLFVLAAIGISTVNAEDPPLLANGNPWQVTVPDGMTVEMTFQPDGSGQVKFGLLANKVSWSVRDGNFCIDGIPNGSACLALAPSGNSVIGTDPAGKQFLFKPI